MTATIEAVRGRALSALRPPPRLALDRWAEQNIRLPAGVSAIPGTFRLWPYQVGIARAISDPLLPRVSVLKSARIGYTVLLNAAIGHFVTNEPSPILAVLPVESDCHDWLVSEIEPTFEASPALRRALTENVGGRDRMLSRRFAGGSLRIVAAKAPRNLRRVTARVVLMDEIDGMETSPEGDPVDLASMRSQTFADRKIIVGSSPTLEETSRICRLYEQSDKRVFEVPCPECGAFHEIAWRDIRWPEGMPATAFYRCPHCDGEIGEVHKRAMIEAGEWRITAPEVEGHAGFRINSLVSLSRNARWGALAQEFLIAKQHPDKLQPFINLILGEPWRGTGEEIDPDSLRGKAEDFGLDAIPAEVRWITAGVDVQRDRLEILYCGWSSDGDISVLGQDVVFGDPQGSELWSELDDLLRETWAHPFGGGLGIDAAAVDAGDGETFAAVVDFCQPRHGRRIYAVKGAAGTRPALATTKTANKKRLAIVGVDPLKGRVVALLTGGAGIRFSDRLEPRFFDEVASERRVIRYRKGVPEAQWHRIPGRAAEGLDCLVYAVAIRERIKGSADRREAQLREVPEAVPARKPTLRRPKWIQAR